MTQPAIITPTTDKRDDVTLWAELNRATALAAGKHRTRFIGHRTMTPSEQLPIITEEVGEVAKALLEGDGLRGELVDVAVCAIAWGRILDWRVIDNVMEGHTMRWGDLAVDAPGLPDGIRLAHLADHHGRLSTAVLHSSTQPDVWHHVAHAALVDIAATACCWIEAIDAAGGRP